MADVFTGTADLLQLADGNISDIDVSELLEEVPFLRALSAIEASNETSHEWLKKTAAPTAGYRDLNDGRENTKATYTKVTQALKLYDASFSIDKGLLKSASGDALRTREARDHLAAAFADAENQIIYGTGGDSDGYNGFANEATVAAFDDTMVVDAGGTTATTGSSVWAVRSGESAVSVVYGGGGRIMVDEEYPTTLTGTTGIYDAMRTPILFWAGVQVATSLDLARIINITEDSGKTLNDDMLADLKGLFPVGRGPSMLVMSRRSLTQLQKSRTATNTTGAPAPTPTDYEGIPIVVSEQLSNTEAISS